MVTSGEALTATVDLRLAESERSFHLPGGGSRSLLYVFDGQKIGAQAVTADRADLVPGSRHEGVVLTFLAEEARTLVATEASFSIWYDGTVGYGVVRSVSWRA